jgi:hypothetical protein
MAKKMLSMTDLIAAIHSRHQADEEGAASLPHILGAPVSGAST